MTQFHSMSEERRIKATLLGMTNTELHNLILGTGASPIKELTKQIVEARELLNVSNPNKEETSVG